MVTINPYLSFAGNTEEAFQFYKSIFGGDFSAVMQWKDLPDAGKVSDAERQKIMHISLPISEKNILMASDALESRGEKIVAGNNFYLAVNTESKEEANKIFKGLSAGGTVILPQQNTFWGSYFGMLTDKFGIQWMVSYELKK
ncbi:VOC family protein [bacterium]|nr:VOC family protein [bacterium]